MVFPSRVRGHEAGPRAGDDCSASVLPMRAGSLHVQSIATTIGGGVLCFALRYMAIRHGWRLPTARVVGNEE